MFGVNTRLHVRIENKNGVRQNTPTKLKRTPQPCPPSHLACNYNVLPARSPSSASKTPTTHKTDITKLANHTQRSKNQRGRKTARVSCAQATSSMRSSFACFTQPCSCYIAPTASSLSVQSGRQPPVMQNSKKAGDGELSFSLHQTRTRCDTHMSEHQLHQKETPLARTTRSKKSNPSENHTTKRT